MKTRFNLSDKVTIINNGYTYTTYEDDFKYLNFKNTETNSCFRNGEKGIVFGYNQNRIAVRHNDGRECLIEESGIELVRQKYTKPMIIFHGRCLNCTNQQKYGRYYCTGCQYFDARWNLPDLSSNNRKNIELTLQEIATKFGYSVDQIRIKE